MKKRAEFWQKIYEKKVKCKLCAHNCVINENHIGFCGVRKNSDGQLNTMIYGSCSSIANDPIEKKPLYHFHPHTIALSLGTVGCNFKCLHCQNYSISAATLDFSYVQELTPEDVVKMAKNQNCQGIAFTYNEPTIWYEFTKDSSKIAKKNNLYIAYVTNGYIAEEPLRELSSYLDAMNIDVKAFTEDFYKKVCKAKLEPVLNTCQLSHELGIHLELTYLVIPGYNDSLEEINNFCKWIVDNLGLNVPVHFSRFHPDYNLTDIKRTPLEKMKKVYDKAKESGLNHVYLGNLPNGEYENTYCPNCGTLCIKRTGYSISLENINKSKCSKCGQELSIIN